jgi:hypothetical protein
MESFHSTVTSPKTKQNSKLANVSCKEIAPFTMDLVEQNLHHFTYDHFLKGQVGLVEFVTKLITNNSNERNYVCTNGSRDMFYRLVSPNSWKLDAGALFLEECLDALGPTIATHYKSLQNLRGKGDPNDQQGTDDNLDKMAPIHDGLYKRCQKEQAAIFKAVKAKIKKLASI